MDLVGSYITSVFTRSVTTASTLRLVDMAQARTENIGHHMSQFETQSLRPESVKLVRHTIKEQVTHAHSRSALFSELSEHHQVPTLYLGTLGLPITTGPFRVSFNQCFDLGNFKKAWLMIGLGFQ